LDRTPGPTKNFVRGRSGYVPFWPGGLEDAVISGNPESQSKAGLKTIPPGFTRGLHLTEDADDSLLALDSVREAVPIGEDELASPFILSTGQFLSCLQAADADAYFDEVQDAAAANTGNEIDKLLPTTVSMGLTVKK
jgi:antiviral helicase SKI2